MSENIQNIQWSHKVYHESHEKLDRICGTIICNHVYIYIYIYVCVCGGLCVLWVAVGIKECITFRIFEAVLDCLEGFPLSILAQRPQKELGPCEPVRLEIRSEKGQRMLVN